MSYLRKVQLQRDRNRAVELKRKADHSGLAPKPRKADPVPIKTFRGLPLTDYENEKSHLSELSEEQRKERRTWKQRMKGFFSGRKA